ncbi:MAG: hypothetical protein K6G03_07590 [Lachnospiraceae bacterium]|nr:hypothetical protein [Lachnospiraceae bacterium]
MKNKIIAMILATAMTALLITGCTTAKQEAASAPAEKASEAVQTAAEEPAEEEFIPGDEDQSDMPSDFLQIRENKVDFKDYDEIISLLKDGEGYAIINVYGSDEPVLAITEQAFLADGSAAEASLYIMHEGKPHSMGIVAGNGSAYPLRIDDKGIIYGGDNHSYETSFLSSDGFGIMQKDYLYDGVTSGDGSIGGFTREDNTSFDTVDFKGTQEEFDKYIEEREALPIIKFTIVGNADEAGASSAYEKALEIYKDTIAHSGADIYAAFADLDDECEALLICSKDDIFTDDKGDIYSTAATIYCLDADGEVAEFGTVISDTTALPLAVKDHAIFSGNHNELISTTLDRANATLKEKSSESFDALDDKAIQIVFKPITEFQSQLKTEPLPAYTYSGKDALSKAVYEYLSTTYRSDYNVPESEATIPIVVEVAKDDKNDADIIVYGDFFINNYSKSGDTLITSSGGEYPGAIHLKKDGDTYTVTKMEVVEDGSDFEPSAKKIFGDNFDAFMKANADEKAREKARIEAIADYVKANDLDITQYQDYGWDPVKIQ